MNVDLIKNNYVLAPSFIDEDRARGLAAEFESQKEEDFVFDRQCPSSPGMYDFMPFVRLLVEKVPYVSDLIGEPVLPTYAYARAYKHGEALRRHRDRAACEVSVTLNLAKSKPWPICIQRPDGSEVCLEQNPGDAMLYLGCVADHWRERYSGDHHVQVFLHYVRANGPKSWAYFDKQKEQDPTPPVGGIPVTRL